MTILRRTVLLTERHHRQIKHSRTMLAGHLLRMRRQMDRPKGLEIRAINRKGLTGLRLHHRRINRGRTITRHRLRTVIVTAITTGIANRVTTCTQLPELQLRCRQANRY